MNSYTYTVGAQVRGSFMIRLDELGLDYSEHRSFLKSVIVVKAYSEADELAHIEFMADLEDFKRRKAARARELAQQAKLKREKERAEELARRNRFRRLTFRKPLEELPR